MRVLGIETSCDETAIAIYDSEKGLLSHVLYSQIPLHADYGGVVPELASRDHVKKTLPLIKQALNQAGATQFFAAGSRVPAVLTDLPHGRCPAAIFAADR